MEDFSAIDFETANHSRGSVCAAAAVRVEDGRIVDSFYSLVRPPDMNFHYFNIRVHGITPAMVQNEPAFDAVWERLRPYLARRLVIAHNAAFDMSVLKCALAAYDLPLPEFRHACTVKIARRVWPGLENFKLNTLAAHFRLRFAHHHALDDARTCAAIALLAQKELRAATLAQLLDKLNLPAARFCG